MFPHHSESFLDDRLRVYFARLDRHFQRSEPREHAYAYLCTLLSRTPPPAALRNDGRNRLLTTARWSESDVRDEVRRIAQERLASSPSVLVVAEEAFVKRGDSSAGVARQYCAGSRRMENVQIGMYLVQSNTAGVAALVDRELYLPRSWVEDGARRARAGIPERLPAHGRAGLALAMLDRSLAAGTKASWVTSYDPKLGDDDSFRAALEERRMPYVLPATQGAHFTPRAAVPDGFERWHTNAWGGAYHSFGPRGSTTEDLYFVAGQASVAGGTLAVARSEVGLERYSVRKYRAWYRHMTLVMVAQVFLLLHGPQHPPAALAPPAAAPSSRTASAEPSAQVRNSPSPLWDGGLLPQIR
ncbi:IS701 family transposase [Streptomyces amakusaensis]|uniref:Transposase n=1 Tax=Streptomyces amakusaensis TaxID=67271 RepID=A0ABW0AHJ4_9ACTN